MRVLFQMRRSYRELGGGDVTVMRRTAEHLRRLGVEVDESCDVESDLSAYDLVHVIDSAPGEETFLQGMNALQQGKPLIATPLYWDTAEYDERGRWQPAALEDPGDPSLARRLRAARRQVVSAKRRFLVEMADMVLPSSEGERRCLQTALSVEHNRFRVVPFAADEHYAAGSAEEFVQQYGLRDFVLCVARIEDNKNQLALVQVCRRLGLPLVLIGHVHPGYHAYLDACQRAAGDATLLVLPHMDPPRLSSAYAAAKVHALVSWVTWFELPALVTLEAALAGCNIVTDYPGPTGDYLGDLVWYCDPGDLDSIASAVAAAHAAPRTAALRDHVRSRYSWARTARATLDAYHQVLAERAAGGPRSASFAEEPGHGLRLLEDLARAQESHLWLKSLVNEDLSRQLAEHKTVLADRERQLAEHSAVLADRERQLAEHGVILADRERQLAEHKTVLADRERQLAEHKTVLASRERQLAEDTAVLADHGV